MSRETIVLLSNVTDDSQPSTWQYGEKHIGAGYYKNGNGVHTMTFELNNFKGSIKVQATLDLNPGVNDWFDVILDEVPHLRTNSFVFWRQSEINHVLPPLSVNKRD